MEIRTEAARVMRATPAFRDLPQEVVHALLAESRDQGLQAGATLFATGREFRGEVYVLVDGTLAVRHPAGDVERPAPGYLVGLSSFLADAPYASTAVAESPCRLMVVPADALRRVERRHPELFDALNRLIAVRLRQQSGGRATAARAMMIPVSAVMSAPLATCAPDTNLLDAVRMMRDANVGSLAVIDDAGGAKGLLTHRSIATHLVEHRPDPHGEALAACRPAGSVASTTPLWRAQEQLRREGVKHLIVTEAGRPAGILSQTNVVGVLVSRQGSIAAAVESAHTMEALRARRESIVDIASEALETNRHARLAVRVVSEAHLAIQRRCIELTLEALESEGRGSPPLPYAWIIMGSGGRREMMLDPDQDNGLIIADDRPVAEPDREWFQDFATTLNTNLDAVGYRLCPGEIMGRNPMFHRTLSEWKDQISRLTRRPSEKAARWSNIVFDFDTQYGERELTREIKRHLQHCLERDGRLLQFMVRDDAQGRAPINLFNRLIATGKRGKVPTVDVKRNGLRIIADAARILALSAGVATCNTSDRLAALVRHGVISPEFEATVSAGYDELLEILLAHQIAQARAGVPPDKEVAPDDLTPPAREALRVSMRVVKRFQDLLQDRIGDLPY